MNANFDKQFEQIRSDIDRTHPPRLLLHVCCAPCATACLLRLVDSFDITAYYDNGNITDIEEWSHRLAELTRLVDIVNSGDFEVAPLRPIQLITAPHDPSPYLTDDPALAAEREGGTRCRGCISRRLTRTRELAESLRFDRFATTLTVSPYKDSLFINETGFSLAKACSVQWLPTDFKKRNGYNESIRLCTKYGIYRQHYCGCVYSRPPYSES